MRKAIAETKNKINDVEKKIEKISDEINAIEKNLENKASQFMSNADKEEEIANERLRRVNAQYQELKEKLARSEISKAEFNSKERSLLNEVNAANTQKAAAIAERKITDSYQKISEYTQEKAEIVKEFVKENKDIIIDAGEFAAQTAVTAAGIALAPISGGPSAAIGTGIVNYEISVYANQLRGQGIGEAVGNAAKDVPVNYALGKVPIVKVREVFDVSAGDFRDGVNIGWKLTGLKFNTKK
jgi:hypothetical protein